MSINPIASSTPSTQTTNNSSTSSLGSGLDQTFMTLLMTELKTQDPTSPMDTTAMVGQMVSLNQLNELISINQTLTSALGTTDSTSSSTTQSSNGATNA